MPSLAVNDVPPGVPGMAAGSGAVLERVPTVAAARATGLPVTELFQSQTPATAPVNQPQALPVTALQRALDIGSRARAGLQQLLGLTGAAAPTPAPAVSNTNALEQGLDALQKRSTMTVFQMRQKAAYPVK